MAIDYVKCRGGICNILKSNNLTLVNMPQVKISGYRDQLAPIQAQLIKIIEDCFAEVTGLTPDKIVQRCYPIATQDLHCPGRSNRYTIIEISMFTGRPIKVTKQLIKTILTKAQQELGLTATELDIMLIELPSHHWGLRGTTGDEL
jgi:phenylpyruvate tautomerase PptA (4-oxalocrotonate tautomerase family)